MAATRQHVEIPTPDGPMGGYLVVPEGGGERPAVLVFMEIFGVNSHIRDVAERVAAEGWVALAPDYFHRTAPGIELGYDEDGFARGMELLHQLKAEEMIRDARAAVDWLNARPEVASGRIGAIGFCIGGHMAYLTACTTDVKAVASYYGGGIAAPSGLGGGPSTLSRSPDIRGRVHCYFGADDALIPPEQVEAIREALEATGGDHRVFVYEGADHGFHCDQRGTYQAEAARDAWEKTKALFSEAL